MSASRVLNVCGGSARKSVPAHKNSILKYNLRQINNCLVSCNQSRTITTSSMACQEQKFVTLDTINPCIKKMEYAVRGPLVIRAGEIEKELTKGVKKPFDRVLRANIGDCHAMGQKPITFIRQVMALVTLPEVLFDDPKIPSDAKEHARVILSGCQGQSVGSYTDSAGIEIIRRHVAEYIAARDGGVPSDYNNIILQGGASGAIKSVMALFKCDVADKPSGIMVPIPQYPLYSATISEFGLGQIGYYLDEENKWGLDIDELQRSIDEAKKTTIPRAIVVINPGNPTGQVLTRKNIEDIIKFAYKEKLFIFADEVYQHNVYAEGSEFHSFKKTMHEMGDPYTKMELASFMSCSKGYMGECGIRGGFGEIINLCPNVKAMLLKSLSAQLCSTTIGQAAMDCVVNPPKEGGPSYELYMKERSYVLGELKIRAKLVAETFNSFEGFSCNPVQGAMYAFPQFKLPQSAIDAAAKANQCADVFYAFQLLERTGICIVPGSGFGQRPGTYHFRTTILPQTEDLKTMLQTFKKFHTEFMNEYK